ncbi:MAG: low affinity iron permease family protein [Luteolibacter sp.]
MANSKNSWFTRFAKKTSGYAGKPATFAGAVLLLVVWAAFGPACKYNDTWQLVINTSTTIVTFLMVFLIQNTQNRDSEALQIKLDELIRAVEGANNGLLDLEELEDKELDAIREKFLQLASEARKEIDERKEQKGKTEGG